MKTSEKELGVQDSFNQTIIICIWSFKLVCCLKYNLKSKPYKEYIYDFAFYILSSLCTEYCPEWLLISVKILHMYFYQLLVRIWMKCYMYHYSNHHVLLSQINPIPFHLKTSMLSVSPSSALGLNSIHLQQTSFLSLALSTPQSGQKVYQSSAQAETASQR